MRRSLLGPAAVRCRTTSPIQLSPASSWLRSESRGYRTQSRGLVAHRKRIIWNTSLFSGINSTGLVSLEATPRCFSHIPPRRQHPQGPSAGGGGRPGPPPSRKKWLLAGGTLLVLIVAYNQLIAGSAKPDRLNTERFIPCTVVSREPVSPTAFILTIQAPNPGANSPIIAEAHRYGMWSVEVKQPQLQIARNYTPLPPTTITTTTTTTSPPSSPSTEDHRQIRFLVRRYESGEVSKYLSRLEPGDTVEIRGPHLGFDVRGRLGNAGRRVVFLAGGTGIAPAIQAADNLLCGSSNNNNSNSHSSGISSTKGDVSVQILWMNREASDCTGCLRPAAARTGQPWVRRFWKGTGTADGTAHHPVEPPGPIMAQLRDLQSRYAKEGKTLDVRCTVDEEGTKFTARDILGSVTGLGLSSTTSGTGDSLHTCRYHSQRQLEDITEELDGNKDGGAVQKCSSPGCGKNLFIISGPEGFMSSYVGTKVWALGAERQGPVGGLVGDLMRKDPETWSDWLILKQ